MLVDSARRTLVSRLLAASAALPGVPLGQCCRWLRGARHRQPRAVILLAYAEGSERMSLLFGIRLTDHTWLQRSDTPRRVLYQGLGLPLPGNTAIKRAGIAGMKDLDGRGICAFAGNRIDGGGVPLVQQIPGVEENRKTFAQLHSRFESDQGIGRRIQEVRVVNGKWRDDPIQVRSRVKAGRGFRTSIAPGKRGSARRRCDRRHRRDRDRNEDRSRCSSGAR